ncbi:MAG: hypothetical protein J7513_01395 [Solirubrobacteraceae bacterium]|nr:hypothetical protein [Solirubrobacteraceae bacterium]
MSAGSWQARPLTPSEAAIVFHPDQQTPWAPSVVVHLSEPLDAALAATRLAALAALHPILDASLVGDGWMAGSGRLRVEADADLDPVLHARFDLAAGPPLRVALAADGLRLAVVGHHAALDGRALIAVASALLGSPDALASGAAAQAAPPMAAPPAPAPTGGAAELLRRVAQPADRVAPSFSPPTAESFAAAPLPPGVSPRASSLAAAAVTAVGPWNAARGGSPWGRIGLTIPVGGPAVLGNVSTHRRVDLGLPADVGAAVTAALAQAAEPPGTGLSPARAKLLRALAPVTDRLSDSLLISNLGRVELPGAAAVDFYPQARGRSAVAIGACTPVGGTARITVRARDLVPADAEALLDRVVRQLALRAA